MKEALNVIEVLLFAVGFLVFTGFVGFALGYGWYKAKAKFPHVVTNTGTTNLVIKSEPPTNQQEPKR